MTKPVKFNLRERLARLTPPKKQPFSRFNLPNQGKVNGRNLQLRHDLANQLFSRKNGSTPSYTQNELYARLADVESVANPPETLREFHEHHLLRVVDQFRNGLDAAAASQQLTELRGAVVRTVFRLAASENAANLALLVGGSAVNGVHTFLTDYDFVVLPHAEADREPAQRVQNMMAELLVAMGIDADFVMPRNFDYLTMAGLEKRYAGLTSPVNDMDMALNGFMFKASASFFRFFMDVQVTDVHQRDAAQPVTRADYEQRLSALQDRLIFDTPDHLVENCVDSFRGMVYESNTQDRAYLYNIKKNPLRLFHYALYANRATLGIRESNFWQVIDQLQERGQLSVAEANTALRALKLFVGLRHLIGLSTTDTMDSTKITPEVLNTLASLLGETPQDLSAVIERSQEQLVQISRDLIQRLGREI